MRNTGDGLAPDPLEPVDLKDSGEPPEHLIGGPAAGSTGTTAAVSSGRAGCAPAAGVSVAGYSPVQAGLAFLPTTVVNFVAAMAVPRLTHRFGNATLLAGSLAVSVVGMAWLSRLSAGTPYLTGIALPMILIGAGQGGALGPLTAAGIAGVAPEDAGAAGGVTNVAHQLGGSLGLGILVAVFAAADSTTLHGPALLAHRISASLTVGAGLLALALVIALAVRPVRRVGWQSSGGDERRASRTATRHAVSQQR